MFLGLNILMFGVAETIQPWVGLLPLCFSCFSFFLGSNFRLSKGGNAALFFHFFDFLLLF